MRNRLNEREYGNCMEVSLDESLDEARCYFEASKLGWCDLGWDDEENDLTIRWTEEGARLMRKSMGKNYGDYGDY